MTDASLLRLIGQVYDAAGDPSALNAFAEGMSREFS